MERKKEIKAEMQDLEVEAAQLRQKIQEMQSRIQQIQVELIQREGALKELERWKNPIPTDVESTKNALGLK